MINFRKSKNVEPLSLENKKIGGVPIEGGAELRVVMTGTKIQLVKINFKEGYSHGWHNHPKHESVGYLIRGKVYMKVGDEEFVLEAGDVWHHPIGVYHETKALETSEGIEIHTPLRPEYM